MNRTFRFLLLLFCLGLLLSACGSWDWSLHYSKKVTDGPWDIALYPEGGEAFAAAYVWDGTDEGRRVVIPDTVEGCTVFKLGGYYGRGLPMPFYIAVPADDTEPAGTGDETAPVRKERTAELLFTIVMGPNLTEIQNIRDSSDFLVDEEDGTRVTYHPVFVFEVDPQNPVFHTDEQGRLYNRKNVLITDFPYPSGPQTP